MTRVVLLGASNVTLGFGVVTRLIRSGFDGPLDIRAAIGHGRSYGAWSRVAGRALPGIVACGLWDGLRSAPSAPTFGLLTDVGNDLMYGFPPATIAGWIAACLDRLAACDARIVVTRLPLARVERLSAGRYHATRLLFFPSRRPVSWAEMLDRARDLDRRVVEAAAARGAAIVTPPLDWYGFDPIHVRRSRRAAAWRTVFAHWPGFAPSSKPARGLPLLGRLPQEARLFGHRVGRPQPIVRRDDATLSLY